VVLLLRTGQINWLPIDERDLAVDYRRADRACDCGEHERKQFTRESSARSSLVLLSLPAAGGSEARTICDAENVRES